MPPSEFELRTAFALALRDRRCAPHTADCLNDVARQRRALASMLELEGVDARLQRPSLFELRATLLFALGNVAATALLGLALILLTQSKISPGQDIEDHTRAAPEARSALPVFLLKA